MSMLSRIQRWLCRHEFSLLELQQRDKTGLVTWPCSKFGKVFREPYGLAVLAHGRLKA
jgi:hypothetical protein